MNAEKLRTEIAVLEAESGELIAQDDKTEEQRARITECNDRMEVLLGDLDAAVRYEELAARGTESQGRAGAPADGEEQTGLETSDEAEGETRGAGRTSVDRDNEAERPFDSFGEQLQEVYRAAANPGHPPDKRLLCLNDADRKERATRGTSGMNEGLDSEGGFAVQTDFAGLMLDLGIKTGVVSSRVDTFTVGPNANGAEWVEVNQTSIASTVAGGVQAYWLAEAAQITASKPEFRDRKLELVKLAGLAYATGEMLQDTRFAGDFLSKSFAAAMGRQIDGTIVSGNGVGKPLGILNAPSLITVAKESGQVADTLVFENLSKMKNAIHTDYLQNNQVTEQGGSFTSLVWLMHPDLAQQLDFLEFPVGTGGVPVYLPPAGIASQGFATLYGLPILLTDHCSAIGDLGDVFLTDLQQYMLIRKGGIRSDTSMHVRFAYDEMAFRFIIRVNGSPKQSSALTIKNSTTARSAIVTLAAR